MKWIILILLFFSVFLVSGCFENRMTIKEARIIAGDSYCADESEGYRLLDNSVYNEDTKTWWIDIDAKREGCNPACVVDEETKKAIINWRCENLAEDKNA